PQSGLPGVGVVRRPGDGGAGERPCPVLSTLLLSRAICLSGPRCDLVLLRPSPGVPLLLCRSGARVHPVLCCSGSGLQLLVLRPGVLVFLLLPQRGVLQLLLRRRVVLPSRSVRATLLPPDRDSLLGRLTTTGQPKTTVALPHYLALGTAFAFSATR